MAYILHASSSSVWQTDESMVWWKCTSLGDASHPYGLSQPKEIASVHMIFCHVYLMQWLSIFLRNNHISAPLYDGAESSFIFLTATLYEI